ncbi:hypothetical protein GCM10027605_01850 [Micromonospora zhanjiangensis]
MTTPDADGQVAAPPFFPQRIPTTRTRARSDAPDVPGRRADIEIRQSQDRAPASQRRPINMPRKSRRDLLGPWPQRRQEQRENVLMELARQLRAEFRTAQHQSQRP